MPANVVVEQKVINVHVSSTNQKILVTTNRVKVVTVGTQGPPGGPGPKGDQGDPGVGIGHEQTFTNCTECIVNHNLGYKPVSAVFLNGVQEIDTEIHHTSVNQLILYFIEPTTGSIRCV